MRRPPRDPSQRLFSVRSVGASILQGLGVFVVVLGVYLYARRSGQDENAARALTFTSLVVANIALILVNRSYRRTGLAMLTVPNRTVWWVIAGATLFLTLALTVPALRTLFHFAPPGLHNLVWAIVAGALTVAWFELYKLIRRARRPAGVR